MGQAHDSDGNVHGIIGSDSGDVLRKMLELERRIAKPVMGDIVKPITIEKVIIAPLPKPGDFLEVNGLKFRVAHRLSDDTFVIQFLDAMKAEDFSGE